MTRARELAAEIETPFTLSDDYVVEIEAWRDQLKDMKFAIQAWSRQSPASRVARMRLDCLLTDLSSLANEIYRSGDYRSWESREEKAAAAKAALTDLKTKYRRPSRHAPDSATAPPTGADL